MSFSGAGVFTGAGKDRYLYDVGSDQALLVASTNSLEAVTGQAAPLNMRSDFIVSAASRVGAGVDATLTFDLDPSDTLTGYLAQPGAIVNAPRFVEFEARAETLTVDGRTFQLLPSLILTRPSGSTTWTRATVSLSHALESGAPQLNAVAGYTLQTTVRGAPGRGLAPFQATFPCDIELEVMEEFVDVYLSFPTVAPTLVEPVFSAVSVTAIAVGAVTYPIVFKQTVIPGVEYMVRMLFDDFDANNLDIGSVTLTVTYMDADPDFPVKYRFVYRDCTSMKAPENVPMPDFTAIVAFGNNRATADLSEYVPYDAFNPSEYNPYVTWLVVGASTLHMRTTYASPDTPSVVDLVYEDGEHNVLVTGANSGTARLTGVPARFTATSLLSSYVTTSVVTVLPDTDALPDGSTHVYVYLDRDQQYVLFKVVTRTLTANGIVHQLVPVTAEVDWSVVTDDTIVYTIPFAVSNVAAPASGGGGSTVIKETTHRPAWTRAAPAAGALVVAATCPLLTDVGRGAPGMSDGTSVLPLTSRDVPAAAWYHPGDHPAYLPWSILADVASSGSSGSVVSSPLISAEGSGDATVAAKAGTKAIASPVGGVFLGGVRLASTAAKSTLTYRVVVAALAFAVPPWAQTASMAGVDCPIAAGVATAPAGTPDGPTVVVLKTTGTGEVGIAVVGTVGPEALSTLAAMSGTSQPGHAFLAVSDNDTRVISTFAGTASGSTIVLVGYSPFKQGVQSVLFEGQPLSAPAISVDGVVTHSSSSVSGPGQVTVVGKSKYRINTARPGDEAVLTAPVSSTTLTMRDPSVLATIGAEVYGTYLETPFIDTPRSAPTSGATVDLTGCVNNGGYATVVIKLVQTYASFAETTATVVSSVATLPYAPPECVAVAIVSNCLVAAYLPAGRTTFALAGASGVVPVTLLFAKDALQVTRHDRASGTFDAWTSQTTAGRLESPNAIAFIESGVDCEPAARVDALTVTDSVVLDYSDATGLAYVRTTYTTTGSDRDLVGLARVECVVLSVDLTAASTSRSKVGGMDFAPSLLVGGALESEGALTVFGDVVVAGGTRVRNAAGDAFATSVTPDGNGVLSLNSVEALTVSRAGAAFFRNGVNVGAVRTLSDYRGGDLLMLDGSFGDSALQHLRRTRFARDLYGHDVRVMPEQPGVDGHAGRFSAGASCVGDWMTGPG